MEVDISTMNYADLQQLRQQVTERMNEMRETGITQLRATIAEQAQLLGVELKDLVPKPKRKYKKREKPDELE
jgi:hypothetical protein